MSETPTQRADRADRMLELCRKRDRVSLAQLESCRNDLREVAEEYEALEAQLKQLQANSVPLDPFGAWLDAEMRNQDLGAADVSLRANDYLPVRSIVRWRKGRTTPNAHEAYRLANALGTSLTDTLTAAGYGDLVVTIVEENDEARAANEPAIGGE